MSPDTGEIHELRKGESLEQAEKRVGHRLVVLDEESHKKLRPMNPRQRKNWMRNKPCPCGVGRKFKKCCWHKYAHGNPK